MTISAKQEMFACSFEWQTFNHAAVEIHAV